MVMAGLLAMTLALLLSGAILNASACNDCESDCKSKFPSSVPDWVKENICRKICQKANKLKVNVNPGNKGSKVKVTRVHEWKISVEWYVPFQGWKSWSKEWSETDYGETGNYLETWGVWSGVSIDTGVLKASAYHHTTIDLSAEPASGWRFDRWEGDCSGSGSCSVEMNGDKTVTAYFVKTYQLTISVNVNEGGTTNPAPGTYTYDEGEEVTVTATPNSGYRFDHWELDGSNVGSDPTIIVSMDGDHELEAYFTKTWHLEVKVGDESGSPLSGCSIRVSPADNNGKNTAYHGDTLVYDDDTTVALSPNTPCGQRVFDHWGTWNGGQTGDCTGTGDCTLKMTSDKGAAAFFWKVVDVTIKVVDQDGASIPSCRVQLDFTLPDNAKQAPDYSGSYADSSTLSNVYKNTRIQARPLTCSDYRFDHWELSGATGDPSNGFTVGDSDVTLKAVYWKEVTLDLSVKDDLGFSVGAKLYLTFTPPPGADNPDVPSNGYYGDGDILTMDVGTTVVVDPNPLSGYVFDHWTDSCSGTDSCSFTMNSDKTLGAIYWKLVDLNVDVEDELGAPIGCTVLMYFSPPSGAQSSPPDPDGSYGNGDVISGLYRGTDVTPSYHICSGYRFDHWELNGASWSGNSFTMDGDCAIKAIYWRQYTLVIKANPATAGDTDTLHTGTYSLDRGRRVSLSPTAYAGYVFDHWELDGSNEGPGPTLTFTMNSDHEVVAHFKKREPLPPVTTVPVAAPVYEGCILPPEFPKEMKYKGMYEDIQFNRDLLSSLAGRAGPGEKTNVIILGGPNVIPYPWEQYEVYFEGSTLRVKDIIFEAIYGEKDYGTILFDCNNMVVRVAGVNRFGTRAALMWLLNHPDKASSKLLIVVQWIDSNYDHRVQDEEITVVYEIP